MEYEKDSTRETVKAFEDISEEKIRERGETKREMDRFLDITE